MATPLANAHVGGLTAFAISAYNKTVDPTVDDDSGDGYEVGSVWGRSDNNTVFLCRDASVGAAIWTKVPLLIDDIQMSSGSQKGLMSAAHYTKLDDLPAKVGNLPVGSTVDLTGATPSIDLSAKDAHRWHLDDDDTVNATGSASAGLESARLIGIKNDSGGDNTFTFGTGWSSNIASFVVADGEQVAFTATRHPDDTLWHVQLSPALLALGEHTFATAYTLLGTDYLRDGIRATGANPTLTVNTGLSIPAGKTIALVHDGTGTFSFAGTATIEKNTDFDAEIMADGMAVLYSTGSDTFKLSGALVAS